MTRSGLAIDLGSARTRVWVTGRGLIADVPTMFRSATGVTHLVRRGSIVNPGGVTELLNRLVHGHTTPRFRPAIAVLTVPALCTAAHRAAAISATAAFRPRTVLTIDGVKAAAAGANVDLVRPRLVIDIGADLTEVALLYDGSVQAAACTALGTSDLDDTRTPSHLTDAILDMVTNLLRGDCGPQVVDALDAGPVLTGGGALQPALVSQLAKRLASPVRPAPMPHTAAVRGAARFVLAAVRHPSVRDRG
jgi:rod shape-determining protein MreB